RPVRAPVPARVSPIYLRPPPPPRVALLPYTTLFRSAADAGRGPGDGDDAVGQVPWHGRLYQPGAPGFGLPPRPSSQAYSSMRSRSEEDTSELQSRENLVCRLLLEKKNVAVRHARQAR